MKQKCPHCHQLLDTTGLAGMTVQCPRCERRVAVNDKSIAKRPEVIGPTWQPTKLQRVAIQTGLITISSIVFLALAIFMVHQVKNIKPITVPPAAKTK